MIHYILQIVGFQFLFLLVYDLFLKRETFFNLNRIYLLVTPIIAAILPLIRLEFIKNRISETFYLELPEVILSQNQNSDVSTSLSLNLVLQGVWIIGMGIAFLIFVSKISKLYRLNKKGASTEYRNFKIIIIPNSDYAFSFFNRIYLGDKISESMRDSIFEHEKIHIKEKHSYDLFLYELFCIILWFNPLVYVFRNRLTLIHEFTADQKASLSLGKKHYFEKLLATVFQTENISFVNSFFNKSLIKTRIIMLQKTQSTKTHLLKYLFILPIIGMMLAYSSCSENSDKPEVQQIDPPSPPIPPTPPSPDSDGMKEVTETESIAFTIIDNPPVFPGCSGDVEELKACFSQNISQMVMDQFNTDIAADLNLEGNVRIMAQFEIDKSGSIVNIKARAPHPKLEDETLRVLKKLPKLKPAEHEGEKVGVLYALPIIFSIE